ncbi:MAG: hypothetical protein COW24_01285 [Candidatus Kerfeldbacteria bacterium CG15_BIG_FIL_POST_REV_8_21_14_020_45_12]|uniref:UDP-N-acetylglucosamine--N-acetylmuramyl-(pentapeptide) pyrophosphoryl-undecaprenol N-acetylglucosamine transferase n=1 Tax=Candidatus Kerfeldbacteria bacterium CG15_BIG_FIL_POST_REV_8_21_14_020_45_12 TaxID=2014247 RepID=A0A2M7H4S2_9BACT|nr:MAG: hypothetical protein COW24_01285 [Candidatus Kerfeldbacteria bacterium CG15_BIG_FIL_POST_REV_8_21_14_020_45_12]PJA93576.1 MAG: hypothetical protein CO132_02460 [Candidatus Kerfeldbacteria bacterium CG_4_9_14_3_um_filter_45_8]
MRILMTGGGTLGSVSPLLAIVPELIQSKDELFFIGTSHGAEEQLVSASGVSFYKIIAPKLRRYFSLRHLLIPFELTAGLIQSARLLRRLRPQAIVSAGGYVAFPVVLVGRLFGIPSILHQQDLRPGLTNKLLAPLAIKITVAFESSLSDYSAAKTSWIGNPVRDLSPTTNQIILNQSLPTVFIFGGGTGAQAINELVDAKLCKSANVIHITGRERGGKTINHPHYHSFEILGDAMAEAYAKADLVVCRAGLGTISELASLGMPAIIIPMPNTHQEDNAQLLKQKDAAIVLDQRGLTEVSFRGQIERLLTNVERRQQLTQAMGELLPTGANQLFIKTIHDCK